MKTFSLGRFSGLLLSAFALTLSSCALMEDPAQKKVSREDAALQASARTEHSIYRSLGAWKRSTYRNKPLLEKATPENVAIEISIKEQRGYLLVRGALAMDFPVATGKKSHPTPTGSYSVRAKEKDYHSNLYGKIFDATGLVLVEDADSRVDKVPEGASFVGASMPYWMRLTDTGVGLHVGYVPGHAASHGCVRLKDDTAKQLFELVKIGTPVTIAYEAPVMAEPVSKKR